MFLSVKGRREPNRQRETELGQDWSMRSAEVTDIALVAFAIVLISGLLIAFVSLH
jgi:hypothetical protein